MVDGSWRAEGRKDGARYPFKRIISNIYMHYLKRFQSMRNFAHQLVGYSVIARLAVFSLFKLFHLTIYFTLPGMVW